MDQSLSESAVAPVLPVINVAAGAARAHPTGPLIIRVSDRVGATMVGGIPLDRVVWFELPLALVEGPWPIGAPLDVVLEDPAREAGGLYALARVHRQHPVRVTLPGRPGIARSARIAMALQVPVRLLTYQPSPEVLAELDEILDIYLHDPRATTPVEFLHSALAWWLFSDAPSLWMTLELDPDWYPRVDADGAGTDGPPAEPGFVARRLTDLTVAGGECAACRLSEWCLGFFKWPDPAYDCSGVKRLIGRLEESATRIAEDVVAARSLEP